MLPRTVQHEPVVNFDPCWAFKIQTWVSSKPPGRRCASPKSNQLLHFYCRHQPVRGRSHLVQIVLDSLLVSWWRRRDADGSLLDSVADSVLTTEHNHS